MRQIKIGKVILTDGGAWNAQTAYTKLTYVTYNGDGWWSAKDNVNSAPSKTNTNWIQATDVQPFIEAVKQATTDAETINAAIREAENLRKQAETSRVNAENARVSSENTRKSNEQTRQSQESSRQSAEATRNTHEQTRETQEAQRQQADTQRQQNYERQMASVTTATELAQQKASDAQAAAVLAVEKAGLADTAATNAQQKAGIASTAASAANTEATKAANVNAVLNGDNLTVTDRNGQSVTRNVRGPKGDSVTMFPAVTIFGQPRIQETQMSEFSAQNYAQFPFLVDFAGRHWQLDCAITTGADVSQQHNVFDSAFGLAFAFSGGKFVLAMSSNGTSWNLGATSGTHSILANTTYYIRITWDGANYVLAYSTDKVSWTNDITVASTESLASKQIIIGKSLDNAHIFNGSINFAEARLTIAGVIVWEGMEEVGTATRMAIDMSNIDEAGKARLNEVAMEGKVGNSINRFNNSLGTYSPRTPLTLQIDKDNMAIDATTGKPVAKAGWAISKPLTIVRGNEYLIKVGTTDGSVWAAAKQTIDPAWDEEVKDPETGEVIDIIHHPEEVYYSKKVQLNAGAELPEDDKLRVLGMPKDFEMVVSFHKATADTTVEVLRDGLTANICTQVGEVDTVAEESLDANMQNVAENVGNVGAVVDTLEYRIGQYPQTLLGHGTPSASARPINLGNDKHTGFPLPWLGTPEFVGQTYVDIDASNGGLYYAIPVYDTYGNITSLKWGNANS